MATITYTRPAIMGRRAVMYLWSTLTTTNADGAPLDSAIFSDKTVQVVGTFGAGGTIVIQGSNDGTNWVTLVDPQGTALSFTSAAMEAILENPRYIRPFVSAGDGTTDLDVYLCAKGDQ